MRLLFVGGTFDDNGGKPSGYARHLSDALSTHYAKPNDFVTINGGTWKDIEDRFAFRSDDDLQHFDVIFWLANIPNDKPKLVEKIKQRNPHAILITSKRNMEDKYTIYYLTARMLQLHSNLMLEFTKSTDEFIRTSIYDPLGNCFLMKEYNVFKVASTLIKRIDALYSYKRVASSCVGEAKEIPDNEEFFALARTYADKFHELVHLENKDRFLGNLTFRCEHGFPSFRDGDYIYVSRRNIDKRDITKDGFVAVEAKKRTLFPNESIWYYGKHKPSVDTPINWLLYQKYPNLAYTLHSHVYIGGIPQTKKVIPCGVVEEAYEIMDMVGPTLKDYCYLNLNGHGSIVLASKIEHLKDIKYIPREFPTMQVES